MAGGFGNRLWTLASVAAACSLFLAATGVTAARGAPSLQLDVHHNQTNFAPGGNGEYWFDVGNAGDAPTSGPITLNVALPAGISRSSVRSFGGAVSWVCPGSAGDSEVDCTTVDPLPRHTLDRSLILSVDVAADAAGVASLQATVEGGGAPVPASATELTPISPVPASFGIVAGSFRPDFLNADATEARQAGSHPDLAVLPVDLNSIDTPVPESPLRKSPAGSLRDLQIDLPPGLLGDPTAVGECTPAQLTVSACPISAQVGRVDVHSASLGTSPDPYRTLALPLFNMSAPRGSLADLAFEYGSSPVHFKARLDPARGYALAIEASSVNETVPALDLRVTLWGVPADPGHDSERCHESGPGDTSKECPAGIARRAFLTLPASCGPQEVTLRNYDFWQAIGLFGPPIGYALSPLTGCDELGFDPGFAVSASERRAETPTGLSLHLEVPQEKSPDSPATPPLRTVELRLPEGMTVSPAAAAGLGSCTPGQIGLGTGDPAECPESSRLGAVSLTTPLLPQPLEGGVFLARQGDNPFGALLAVYLVIHDVEERGVLLKIPGRLDLDPETGRVRVDFENLPQLPFERLDMSFRGGARAPFVNPPTCGVQSVEVETSSYAQTDVTLRSADSYRVEEGPAGTPCPVDLGARPFGPRLEAGTVVPRAGARTPFVLRLDREDDEQGLSQIRLSLPPGLSAKLKGTPRCSEAVSPLPCPAASQVGTATARAGAGSEPVSIRGRIFLGGPYKGAPLSLQTVVPVEVGPLDLGAVTVRTALHVDPRTTRVTAVTDPLPRMLAGIPLQLRGLSLTLDGPDFVRNPTSCEETEITGTVASSQGAVAPVRSRFQVGGCARVGFDPGVSVQLTGPTHRGAHPGARAVLRARTGDANVRRIALTLPATELLDNRNIAAVCTDTQLSERDCPAAAAVGHLEVRSPLLGRPLRGQVYLRAGSRRLPDLAAILDGEVELQLAGRIDSVKGRLRTTFSALPDVPWRRISFVLDGGRHGLLVNAGGVCAHRQRVKAAFKAHSGKVRRRLARVREDCGGADS